jgi:transcriptional regulator of acetoin/glycerol metabolism
MADLEEDSDRAGGDVRVSGVLRERPKRGVLAALERASQGIVIVAITAAAKRLGMGRATLYRNLAALGLRRIKSA